MAQFSVEINNSDINRVLNAISANYARPDRVKNPDFNPAEEESETNNPEIDNPETKAQFANRKVREFLSENVKAYELRLAKEAAAANTNPTINIIDPQT